MEKALNSIIPFGYGDHLVRVIKDENGNPWWIAKDVCAILEISNVTAATQQLDDDERSSRNLGRQGETNIINEPGLYTLIIRSNKPEAKSFRRWITHEVLPAIRQTGAYATDKAKASQQRPKQLTLCKITAEFSAAMSFYKKTGDNEDDCLRNANQFIQEKHGVDCCKMFGVNVPPKRKRVWPPPYLSAKEVAHFEKHFKEKQDQESK